MTDSVVVRPDDFKMHCMPESSGFFYLQRKDGRVLLNDDCSYMGFSSRTRAEVYAKWYVRGWCEIHYVPRPDDAA
jgi:hypothetical protein